MRIVWIVLGAVGFASAAAFLVLWVLALTGHVPPGQPLAISCGVMLLTTGLSALGSAADENAERGKWARPNVKLGRLSALTMGMFFCAIAAGMIGAQWLPKEFGIAVLAIAIASFAWPGTAENAMPAAHRQKNRHPEVRCISSDIE